MQKTVTTTVAAVAVTVAVMAETCKEMLLDACRGKWQTELWRKDAGSGGKMRAVAESCRLWRKGYRRHTKMWRKREKKETKQGGNSASELISLFIYHLSFIIYHLSPITYPLPPIMFISGMMFGLFTSALTDVPDILSFLSQNSLKKYGWFEKFVYICAVIR